MKKICDPKCLDLQFTFLWRALLFLLIAVWSFPQSAGAETPDSSNSVQLQPHHRIAYSSIAIGRVNPLGLLEQLTLGYRYRLYDNPGPLWKDAYIGVSLTPLISPALAWVGGQVEIQPLSVIKFTAGCHYVSHFGTFGYIQSFASPRADYSDTSLDAAEDLEENYSTSGIQFHLSMLLQGKVGPVAFRNTAVFTYTDLDLHAGESVYYDIFTDLLIPDGGWKLMNDTDLVYIAKYGIVAGLRASVNHAFYRSDDFIAGESTNNPNSPTFRVGPLVTWTISDEWGTAVKNPTVIFLAGWWLKHRFRTGSDVSQALPCAAVAFRFEGDLWAAN